MLTVSLIYRNKRKALLQGTAIKQKASGIDIDYCMCKTRITVQARARTLHLFCCQLGPLLTGVLSTLQLSPWLWTINHGQSATVPCNTALYTSSSAIAEKPRCSVGQFWVAITPYSADRPISIKSNQIEIID